MANAPCTKLARATARHASLSVHATWRCSGTDCRSSMQNVRHVSRALPSGSGSKRSSTSLARRPCARSLSFAARSCAASACPSSEQIFCHDAGGTSAKTKRGGACRPSTTTSTGAIQAPWPRQRTRQDRSTRPPHRVTMLGSKARCADRSVRARASATVHRGLGGANMGGERVVLRSKVGAGKVSVRVKEHGGAGGKAEHICWQWWRALS